MGAARRPVRRADGRRAAAGRADHHGRGRERGPGRGGGRGRQPAPTPTPSGRPAATPSSGPGRFAVAYEVTGQGPANIQYYDADGYLVELDRVRLPWHTTIRTDDPSRASVMANKGDDKGGRTIACAMTVNGGRPVTESVDDRGWRVGCGG
ncbi:MmpS family transport accessory protein [Micromonospora sp. ATA51]|uniref:MmpS family transport accessory protein n=1 Tax=Micromonospora sp. ATA51 TaxID=2806098 RepID=UPI001EE45C94|nr:MmpS family transport accessory protein [Micromonospora sp. ATA51]